MKPNALRALPSLVLLLLSLANTPAAAAPASAETFLCTQIIGVSVTGDWFGAGFEDGIDGGRWQALWRKQAFVESWADPASDLWSMKPQSPCALRSDDPDHVIFTGVNWEYKTREAWQEKLSAVVETIRKKYPGVRRIDLITMLRGPGNRTCGNDMTVVEPYIDDAVAAVAALSPGLVFAGPKVVAESCDIFTKGGPHYTDAGMAVVARLYREQLAPLAPVGHGQTATTRSRKPDPAKAAGAATNPLAQRLCDALQGTPAKRKNECCGTNAASVTTLCSAELSASLARGAVTLEGSAVDRCAAETSRQLEGCDWVTPLLPRQADACRNVIQGQLKAGVACRSSLECVDGLFCRGSGPGKPGVCATPSPARARCEIPADNLATFVRAEADGRHPACAGLCVKGQCVPVSAAGGACQSTASCQAGLHCLAGHCQDQPLPKLGEPCPGNTSCGSGAFCHAGRCEAVKNAGEACVLPVECRALACVTGPGEKSGKCGDPCGLPSRH